VTLVKKTKSLKAKQDKDREQTAFYDIRLGNEQTTLDPWKHTQA